MDSDNTAFRLKFNYAANYGLLLGGYLAVFYLLQYFFGTGSISNVLFSVCLLGIPILGYFIACNYRDKAGNGYMRFVQVWEFGILLFFFAGLIMSVVYFIDFTYLRPDYLSETFNQSLLMLEQMNYPKQTLDLIAKDGAPTPIQMVVWLLFAYVIGGAVLFLLISPLVARKNPDEYGIRSGKNTYEPYENKGSDSEIENEGISEQSGTTNDDETDNDKEDKPES